MEGSIIARLRAMGLTIGRYLPILSKCDARKASWSPWRSRSSRPPSTSAGAGRQRHTGTSGAGDARNPPRPAADCIRHAVQGPRAPGAGRPPREPMGRPARGRLRRPAEGAGSIASRWSARERSQTPQRTHKSRPLPARPRSSRHERLAGRRHSSAPGSTCIPADCPRQPGPGGATRWRTTSGASAKRRSRSTGRLHRSMARCSSACSSGCRRTSAGGCRAVAMTVPSWNEVPSTGARLLGILAILGVVGWGIAIFGYLAWGGEGAWATAGASDVHRPGRRRLRLRWRGDRPRAAVPGSAQRGRRHCRRPRWADGAVRCDGRIPAHAAPPGRLGRHGVGSRSGTHTPALAGNRALGERAANRPAAHRPRGRVEYDAHDRRLPGIDHPLSRFLARDRGVAHPRRTRST